MPENTKIVFSGIIFIYYFSEKKEERMNYMSKNKELRPDRIAGIVEDINEFAHKFPDAGVTNLMKYIKTKKSYHMLNEYEKKNIFRVKEVQEAMMDYMKNEKETEQEETMNIDNLIKLTKTEDDDSPSISDFFKESNDDTENEEKVEATESETPVEDEKKEVSKEDKKVTQKGGKKKAGKDEKKESDRVFIFSNKKLVDVKSGVEVKIGDTDITSQDFVRSIIGGATIISQGCNYRSELVGF